MSGFNPYNRWNFLPAKLRETGLTQLEEIEFKGTFGRIITGRERVIHRAPTHVGDLLAWNINGDLPPLFWCFNNWAEPFLLAAKLPENQPLFALHSFHGYTENWGEKGRLNEALAHRYLDSVKKVADGNRLIFGGNCQGGPIAESLAIQYERYFEEQPFLVTLDYIGKRPYQGDRVLIFGEKSNFNPFQIGHDPIPYWKEKHAKFSWYILTGAHGSYFREPQITTLAQKIGTISESL